MTLAIAFFIFGFVLLLKGADWMVEGSCSIAKRVGVSQLIVGLTLVSFGTSLPEFFINIISRFSGKPDITLGDILGSNIANILLVLGLSASIHPLLIRKSTVTWEIPFSLVIAIVLALLVRSDVIFHRPFAGLERFDGFILLIFFVFFLFYIYRLRKKSIDHEAELPAQKYSISRSFFMVMIGIPLLAIGAKGVVQGGVAIASMLGIPESVIALSIVAVGTSLPELATSVVAACKKRSDIAVGNVVGSNIFNICWILGISAAFNPLAIPSSYFPDIDMVIASPLLLFLVVFFSRQKVLGRSQGFFFVLLYIVYVISLVVRTAPGV